MFKGQEDKSNAIAIGSILLMPKSRGTIRLKSQNPFDHPVIDPKYLSHKQDVDVIFDGKN